ncbi:MAG: hypothetical protein V4597_08165 [Pseudomonadota bacterium]
MTDHDFLSATFQSIALPPQEPTLTGAPLQCDRWIARSALQKAVRRGEGAMAQRAALNLLENDPRSAWRALVIVGLEDVGFGSWTALSEVVALAQSSVRRKHLASEAVLVSYAVQRLASGGHCQAACDLLMRATNDPAWELARADLADANPSDRRDVLACSTRPLIERAVALLALLNDPAGGTRSARADVILEVLCEAGPVLSVANAAWRATGNEMALMLPLLESMSIRDQHVAEDLLLPLVEHEGIPLYALDQFTRTGKSAINRLIYRDASIQVLLNSVTADQRTWAGMVADALFIVEGSPVLRRAERSSLSHLRLPFRPLVGAFALGQALTPLTNLVTAAIPALNRIREDLLSTPPHE